MHSLREALNEKRPEWLEKHNNLILQHDNAPAHNATVVKNTIKDLGWELLPHPPYSPDLASSDYHLFTFLGHALKSRNFRTQTYSENGLLTETGLSVYLGIMRCLRDAVRLKRPERWQNNEWILHVGIARPHTAHVVLQFLAKHSTIQIPHPPYSPDLAPNDFFLYPKLKMNLKGRKFDNVDMIQAESKATLRNLSKSDFISCFDNWKKKMERVY
ncbi:hypothetical protein LAZ67_14000555 [Cordylochernes scorpioides]|uniref:Transposase n=1 Tax=Cordylochernes scorpioides TaxID=51811 RepID=A0ABY6L5S1_9ARAC|nr:hypothetical protein LAZ67_14000555 [Cordylochernes scorpioides]